MLEKGRGKIVNVASLLSFQGGITVPAYAAAKGGVAQLTKALANEWAGRGVNVNAHRSRLRADRQHGRAAGGPRPQPPDPRAHPGRPLGRARRRRGRRPSSSASAASDYVHGHVLVVDGGWMGR